ncbi:hypothetical protein GCM10022261_30490 [Brevibacterium daeguense]|uniref:Lsr2 protein n=1 Tax=Brevibacterium daeguense TaxID=909936 RepID=A0ABP8ENK8_9MICO|nr:hypothetical protein [Brevibacterium daeguense]
MTSSSPAARGHQPVDSAVEDTHAFSAELIAAGVHYLYALSHDVTAAEPGAQVPSRSSTEVSDVLRRQGASGPEIERVLQLIGTGMAAVSQGGARIFTKDAYDAARDRAVAGLEHSGDAGHRLWPPTSQTVRKRLGSNYWNEALSALGYPVSGRGRARGAARYSPDDFVTAVADFLAAAARDGSSTSFVAYEAWNRDQRRESRIRPSGAAVRSHFGGWQAAKDAAEGISGPEASDGPAS